MTTIKRTIKFRAKAKGSPLIQDGTFVYGCLVLRNENMPVIDFHGYVDGCGVHYEYTVDKDTIGQFTGLHDKNGKEIYEGDIVKMSTAMYGDEIFKVSYENSHIGAFCLCSDEQEDTSRFVSIFGRDYGYEPFYCEVIGNIHDNPELLKGGQE